MLLGRLTTHSLAPRLMHRRVGQRSAACRSSGYKSLPATAFCLIFLPLDTHRSNRKYADFTDTPAKNTNSQPSTHETMKLTGFFLISLCSMVGANSLSGLAEVDGPLPQNAVAVGDTSKAFTNATPFDKAAATCPPKYPRKCSVNNLCCRRRAAGCCKKECCAPDADFCRKGRCYKYT